MRKLATVYLLSVHALLAAAAWSALGRGDADPARRNAAFHARMLGYHASVDALAPAGCVVFLGDSITQGLAVAAVADRGVNFGVGSDTAAGLLRRLPRYGCLLRARAVVVEIGLNDLRGRSGPEVLADYGKILEAIPPGVPVVWSAVLPVDESAAGPAFRGYDARIAALNAGAERLCSARPGCRFVPAPSGLTFADGIHPDSGGYRLWAAALGGALP